MAAEAGNTEDVKRFLQYDLLDINCLGSFGEKVPYIKLQTSDKGHKNIVQLLDECWAEHDKITRLGWTPSHHAVTGSHKDVVEMLICAGADLNRTHGPYPLLHGETSLQVAAQLGRVHIVKLLLDNGADPDKADDSGWTPLQQAIHFAH